MDPDLKTFIRSGGVSYELLRPLDLYANWYSRAIAPCARRQLSYVQSLSS